MNVSLVVPVFNEELAIPLFYQAVRAEPSLHLSVIEIVFINDGSTDRTEQEVRSLVACDNQVVLVNLSRNFGKEAALLAGLEYASGEAVIPVDVDLQHPIHVIARLIEEWQKGADVVLAKRDDRAADGPVRRRAAAMFYRLLNLISNTRIEENVGDFRLMDRKVVDVVKAMPEQQLFMKGLLAWPGFTTAVVDYHVVQRAVGTTKFNAWKLWGLAIDGITSFSTVPLHVWTYIGSLLALLACTFALYRGVDMFVFNNDVPAYSFLLAGMLFLGGIQLIGIGILGEYVGRIYMEVKHRPRYVVKSTAGVYPGKTKESAV